MYQNFGSRMAQFVVFGKAAFGWLFLVIALGRLAQTNHFLRASFQFGFVHYWAQEWSGRENRISIDSTFGWIFKMLNGKRDKWIFLLRDTRGTSSYKFHYFMFSEHSFQYLNKRGCNVIASPSHASLIPYSKINTFVVDKCAFRL